MEISAEARSILACLHEPAILLSPDYRILMANEAYERVYGHGQPLARRFCYEVSHRYQVPCDQAGETCPLQGSRESGQPNKLLHIHYTPRGEEYVDIEAWPIRGEDGEIAYFIEVMKATKLAAPHARGTELIGRSQAFRRMLEMVHRIAPTEATVLLLGETGSGKEIVARSIHESSPRSGGLFVPVECTGVPATLFESELFGHVRGAFTNAVADKPGLVETADGGTLFLDEIGDIPLVDQVKILRLLETRRFRRVGSVEYQTADFRLVCATNKDLAALVATGDFREDLYYRLNTFEIELPPLRERQDDLALLIENMIGRMAPQRKVSISPAALGNLEHYGFPGNIRELKNIVERALVLCDGNEILPEHLPERCLVGNAVATRHDDGLRTLAELEADYLRQAVARHPGDRKSLARALGVSERALYRKLSKLRDGS